MPEENHNMTIDLYDDSTRYVAEALKAVAPKMVSVEQLVENYDVPEPNNWNEVRGTVQSELGRPPTGDDVKEKLIRDAIGMIASQNPDALACDPADDEDEFEECRLADGVDADDLMFGGEPLIRRGRVLPDLFSPGTGAWLENIRTPNPQGFKELRESMQAFGWPAHLPAIADENGVIIVGHRRLTVAEELGIEPLIETVHFGEGDNGDAKRAAWAIASNIGFEKLSPADRKKIAARMYGSGWSMQKIANVLKVATMTVSRDLRNLTNGKSPSDQPKRGRPRKERSSKLTVVRDPEPEAEPEFTPLPAEEQAAIRERVAADRKKIDASEAARKSHDDVETRKERELAGQLQQARADLYGGIAKAILTLSGYGGYEDIPKLMSEFDPAELNPPQLAQYFELEHLEDADRLITQLIEWRKNP
jgi:ParB-like chromosome segregation protein Spo0J